MARSVRATSSSRQNGNRLESRRFNLSTSSSYSHVEIEICKNLEMFEEDDESFVQKSVEKI